MKLPNSYQATKKGPNKRKQLYEQAKLPVIMDTSWPSEGIKS